jgi:hypothetical protein
VKAISCWSQLETKPSRREGGRERERERERKRKVMIISEIGFDIKASKKS